MEILIHYGIWAVLGVMFLEQVGLPIPAAPVLMAAGALAGQGKMSLLGAMFFAIVGSLAGDLVWFYIGRLRGVRVLGVLCKISISPDTCVRRTENTFVRYGVRTLLVAKFLPGFNTIAPPLAGVFRVTTRRFILFDGLGAALYSGVFILLGWLFSDQLERIIASLAGLGKQAFAVLGLALTIYILYKVALRQMLLRRLRMNRITPEELQKKIAAGEMLVIVDLRSKMEIELMPYLIPGALHIPAEEVDGRHHEIPIDQDIITYCSCPNEITSASVALKLHKKGFKRVRPLLGGISGWRYAEGVLAPVAS